MPFRSLEDMETEEEIKDSCCISLCPPEDKKAEVFLSKSTFKKRAMNYLLNSKRARNFRKDLGIRIYRVYLKTKEKGKKCRSKLAGYLTEKTIREKFPKSYRFLSYLNPNKFTLKDIKSLENYILT